MTNVSLELMYKEQLGGGIVYLGGVTVNRYGPA